MSDLIVHVNLKYYGKNACTRLRNAIYHSKTPLEDSSSQIKAINAELKRRKDSNGTEDDTSH